MPYRVELTAAAERQLRRLPREAQQRLEPSILDLETEPHPRGAIKLASTINGYRIRVGPFRVLYEIRERE